MYFRKFEYNFQFGSNFVWKSRKLEISEIGNATSHSKFEKTNRFENLKILELLNSSSSLRICEYFILTQ